MERKGWVARAIVGAVTADNAIADPARAHHLLSRKVFLPLLPAVYLISFWTFKFTSNIVVNCDEMKYNFYCGLTKCFYVQV